MAMEEKLTDVLEAEEAAALKPDYEHEIDLGIAHIIACVGFSAVADNVSDLYASHFRVFVLLRNISDTGTKSLQFVIT